VQDGAIYAFLSNPVELLVFLDILISIGYAAYILHCSMLKIRYKHLVEFSKGVISTKQLLVVFYTRSSYSEPVFGNRCYVLLERLSTKEAVSFVTL
jgi:hypothetical protein